MKKIVLVCAVLFVLAGCTWGKANETSFSENAPSTLFKEMTVTWGGAISPESISKEVVIDNNLGITVHIQQYSEFELKGECTSSAKLSVGDYSNILTLLDRAHLDVYFPGPDCAPLYGSAGITIAYQLADGTSKEYTTLCDLDPQITELVDTVESIATADVGGCSEESFGGTLNPSSPEDPSAPEQPSAPEEQFCGESSLGACTYDTDCTLGCHSYCEGVKEHNDEEMCTQIYVECENYVKYNVSCGCVDGKCSWK
jgi:hypothetical protein